MPTQKPQSASVHPGPGFRIRSTYPAVTDDVLQRLKAFEVPDISDALNRLYALDSDIKCLNAKPYSLCGNVCTVSVFPGDNLMVHKALDIARPGDIIVVAAHGRKTMNAVLGDRICTKAKHRGIAGFIIDGLVRDMPGIDELEFPVFARGTTAVGPLHRGPGEINYPVACGGIVVNPGDVVVADISGIVVVPNAYAEELLARLDAQRERTKAYLASVARGEFSNAWVDEILEANDCPHQ